MKAAVLGFTSMLFAILAGMPIAAAAVSGDVSPDGVWTVLDPGNLLMRRSFGANPWIRPDKFAVVEVEGTILADVLRNAPLGLTGVARESFVLLSLPSPEGTFDQFEVWESPVMEPELARWMAERGWPMKTYKGRSVTNPVSTVRLDWGGPAGFHASVDAPGQSYQIDPGWQGDRRFYLSYYVRDYTQRDDDFYCYVIEHSERDELKGVRLTPLNTLRNFRLANAATAEYTAFHGGTIVDGQAAIVTTINRVNQVYERDQAIHLTLIGNNNLLVYTNAVTDPYTDDDASAMISQNQANIDSVIGSGSYDIGHVFSTGGGGLASLGVVCNNSYKARGVTGNSSPQGDPFDIDYVAHEIGHQFGANHTFDGVLGSCAGGNRNDSTAYEPGSGATIMAYAGICGSDNIQINSDAFFHGISVDEIQDFLDSVSCYTTSATGNNSAPTVEAGGNYTIPANTPFELTATNGADGDGDSLTYSWEEHDLSAGASGDPLSAGDQGDNPIFRAWFPTSGVSRIFPRLGNLLSNTTAKGETLPTTSRTMTFRVVVRDNHANGGLTGFDTMTLTTTTAAGPFKVTSPSGGETLSGALTAAWDGANTQLSPVNATNVNIMCSLDGGQTFSVMLASNTPNDGSEVVFLPNISNNTARIKVAAAKNIFFDISDTNFSLRSFVSYTLEVISAHGTPSPAAGLYTNVCSITLSAAVNSPAGEANGTRYICTGWIGTGSVPASGTTNTVTFTITNNSTLTWNWSTQFFLAVSAGANGTVDPGGGWYNSGTAVTITARPDAGYFFVNWTGDVPTADQGNNPLSVTMDRARNITANFSSNGPASVSSVVCADYDGDGKADPAVYDEATGTWKVKLSSAGYYMVVTTLNGLGGPGYASVSADYDGDRKADPAVYQETTGIWIILPSSTDYTVPIVLSQTLGGAGYSAMPADYDADVKADPGVYQRAQGDWKVLLSSAAYSSLALLGSLGGTGYLPAAADYDGDHKADPAVYGESNGVWVFKISSANYLVIALAQTLGGTGYIPVPADYDGDGLADPAVRSETSNEWIVMFSSGNYTPVPLTVVFD